MQTEPRGTIRVTCPVTLAQTTIGPLMPLFLERHPQVRVDMQVSNRVVDLVQDGVDVALRVRPTLDDSGSLVVKNLGNTQGLLVASPAQLRARRAGPQSLEDLQRLPRWRCRPPTAAPAGSCSARAGASSISSTGPCYTADDLLTLKYAVLQGHGHEHPARLHVPPRTAAGAARAGAARLGAAGRA